jgi:hypothetical protein
MSIKIKIQRTTMLLLFAGTFILSVGYYYLHIRVITPIGEINVEQEVKRLPETLSEKKVPLEQPEKPVPIEMPEELQAFNVSGPYQAQGSSKVYILAQNKNRIKFFEKHPIYGDVSVGNGIIEGEEIVANFFSTLAYGNVPDTETSGILQLKFNKNDHSLRGAFFIQGAKKQDVTLIPQLK